MSTQPSPYQSSFTRTFEGQLAAIERKDKVRGSRIREEMDEILASPYGNVEFGKGQWRGKRKQRIGTDRLIFVVCKQCRELKHVDKLNTCSDCGKTPDETVVWVTIIEDHKY